MDLPGKKPKTMIELQDGFKSPIYIFDIENKPLRDALLRALDGYSINYTFIESEFIDKSALIAKPTEIHAKELLGMDREAYVHSVERAYWRLHHFCAGYAACWKDKEEKST